MSINTWFFFGGLFFLVLVVIDRWLRKAPVSSSIVYLVIGVLLGPSCLHIMHLDAFGNPTVMETAAEIVVIVSLFSAGLKMQFPLKHLNWKVGALLASGTMLITVSLLAVVGFYLLNLSWGAAILLGGILAPTDPVLASEVQVAHESDQDQIRRSLTGEAGLNDGSAFPAVMLGLVLLGERWTDSESPLLSWITYDFLWAIPAALLIGGACGWSCAKFVMKIHSDKDDRLVIEDFMSIGLIGAAYGLAQLVSAYGFLSVFAAAVMFGHFEKLRFNANSDNEGSSFSPQLIRFSSQLERIGEVAIVLFIGYSATALNYSLTALLVPVLLLFFIRPLGVYIFLREDSVGCGRGLIAWFGIRGIGSVYYLFYALAHGLVGTFAEVVYNSVMVTIVVSILLHGVSAAPLMRWYQQKVGPEKAVT